MPTAVITEHGVVPPLADDEKIRCGHCDTEFDREFCADPDQPEWLWSTDHERPVCPVCEVFGALYRVRMASPVAGRWPANVMDYGWTAVPNLLLTNARALDLDPTDIFLMLLFERYRRTSTGAVYPGVDTIADEARMDERTVRRRVDRWVERGLWEKVQVRSRDGRRRPNRLTREGLNEVLALIAMNRAEGRPELDDVDGLLANLVRPGTAARSSKKAPPALAGTGARSSERPGTGDATSGHGRPQRPGTGARGTRKGEQEQVEQEPSFRRHELDARALSSNNGWTPEGAEAFIRKAKAMFPGSLELPPEKAA